MIHYVWLFVSVLLGAAGQVLMKWGVGTPKPAGAAMLSWSSMASYGPIAAGLACYGLSSVFWLLALKKFPLSTAYPMVSLGYIVVMVLGFYLFHESLSMQTWIGAAFISFGVLLIARA
ncbi:SMR family transporter [Paenibacillus validus]|uniref:SMR family transporter n=1 Tax=Paenibacillus validus TaxID=44253 RepID=UPI0013DF1E34|nr:SMR family transporter [Paenibacillus validus]MED4601076.1 SMR family transporter [Paenibacillus validus]MED4607453.1 SMR family transporter [Paenibacillus validus]